MGQAGPELQVNRTEIGRGNPRKDGGSFLEDGHRKGWYLVSGVSVPHDQLPILRGTYQQPGERASMSSLPLFPASPSLLDPFESSLRVSGPVHGIDLGQVSP